MIDVNLFQNSHIFWHVVLIALVLWILFVWKEWSSPVKNRFYFYSLISLITVLSFAMLALRPFGTSLVKTNTGVLLTDGYNQKRLDSLKQKVSGIKVYEYQENLPIADILDSISSLFILGNGTAAYDFWQFENRSVSYLGGDLPDGIIYLKYDQENILGDDLEVLGRYRNAEASNRIVLQDGNGRGLDSIVFTEEISQNFKLSTPLKAKGKFVFKLVEKDSIGDTILSEPLPFKVMGKTNFKILIVNRFPTFETKYLKNYLAEMGNEVIVRSQLTRGRYKFEYFNTNRVPIYRLDDKSLEDFDLLIIDGDSFSGLSRNSWASIEKAIKSSELGLFVQPTSNVFRRQVERLGFEFERDGISKVVLDDFSKVRLDKFPFRFKTFNGIEEIHSWNNNPATAYKRMEKGRIGISFIQNTYQLQLDGKTEVYRQFWSEIINKISKKKELITDWQAAERFPLKNQPFQFELRTSIETPRVFTDYKEQIALRQDIDIPSLWSGKTYPKTQGWNVLSLEAKSQGVLDFYVSDSSYWKPLRANNLQNANRRNFANTSEVPKKSNIALLINPIVFFVLGLLGMGFLWLHPKLFND